MIDYISREALKDAFEEDGHLSAYVEEMINAIPAADVRPVVRGKWRLIVYEIVGHDYQCSECGWNNDMASHFCPNCGADMRETEHD